MAERLEFTTPVGRLVAGSVATPNTTDYEGKPLTMKDNVTPRVEYSFGVAFPKTPGVTHWSQEPALQGKLAGKPWLADIWALGHASFPNGEAHRGDFAWKITDGDSAIPNRRGTKPCDREGYKGHWVIFFTGGFKPQIWNKDGTQQILDDNAVKRGYFVQVCGNSTKNTGASPGLYMNYSMIALAAYGPEIVSGPDVATAGFGGAALPAGATETPAAGAFNPAPPPPGAPVTQAPPPAPPTAPVAGVPVTNAPPPPAPPVAVAPNPAILGVPTPPPAAPAAPAKQLTDKAGQATYEQLIGAGWTDALLIQNGMMLA